ncbi:uncharacterized protein C8R40DRAFT_290269 [Lentinula edodes]|uniref:uncharacterized protein n=1 Tax=Lentinula edodes TaxID=5353 RepID=UPI001E8EADFA|nr:uncharacterized protein C8R40DRAFT_290269 [Lentinula edodes]KAH7874569.1 hypothetical protein C8R40DRAFT_290269 [Lentinula edodes]
MEDIHIILKKVTKDTIIRVCAGCHIAFSSSEKRTKLSISKRLQQLGDDGVREILARLEATIPDNNGEQGEGRQRRKRRKLVHDGRLHALPVDVDDVVAGDVFSIPNENERQKIVNDFLDRTGTEATKLSVCYSCARELSSSETRPILAECLPNSHLLTPESAHPAHTLTKGLLLYRDPTSHVVPPDICCECLTQLANSKRPVLSLANNMWVGEVPFELKILSLPEVILVSRYLAAAYVVKLYPKKRSAKWMSGDQLTSALRGNVASYYLKTEDVASMVDEGYLPPRSTVLAATIAVTFIGQNNISLRALKTMFTVERLKVANALRWLIANNKFYAHIKISEANLQSLPMNGVPVEILSTTKWASDADVGAGEYEGYVPHNDDVSSDDGLDDVEGQMMNPGTT